MVHVGSDIDLFDGRNRKKHLAKRCKDFLQELSETMGTQAVLMVGYQQEDGTIARSM